MRNKYFIGCSGFTQGYWKGFFYPENLPSRDHLQYYAEHLKTVEINSTFYRKPMLKTLEKWYDATPEDFQFFLKIPKNITHVKKLNDTAEETSVFCSHICSGLKEKVAGFLFQLPGSFKFSEENLAHLIESADPKFVNVVEFRDKSWWTEQVYEKLKANNIVFSGVSYPKDLPRAVMVNNGSLLYYRLHGIPVLFKSEYAAEELESLAKELKNFKGKVFVFFNNTWGTAGIKNALELDALLRRN
ncbi:DUF72 domain-containing protein [Kaistella palustris]|uniref:DUF72 domain-containing protein n=1 Tax=Kaistella palustris TaxID=493376 RepID=UPI000413449B|nr:DUF72 domain-containing protein [Kaistella palustris]